MKKIFGMIPGGGRCILLAKMIIFMLLLLTMTLAGCATPTATQLAGKPERPTISAEYQKLLMTRPDIAKQALSHEWDWQGYADKMEQRVGYK